MHRHAFVLALVLGSFAGAVPARASAIEDCAEAIRKDVAQQIAAGLNPEEGEIKAQTLIAQQCAADPQAPISPERALFIGSLNREYTRLGLMFLSHALDSRAYLGLLRDRNAKRRLAAETPNDKYYELFSKGDEDGDFVPDKLDRCPRTSPSTVTTKRGCPDPRNALPATAPEDRLVRLGLAHYNVPFDEHCLNPTMPGMPGLLKLGYNSVDRTTIKLAVQPVPRVDDCPIYYEFNVAMHTIQFGQAIEEGAGFVFKDSDSIESGPRAVFVIPETATGQRGVLFEKYKFSFKGAHWRVRAVNGGGVAGPWAPVAFADQPSFGEP